MPSFNAFFLIGNATRDPTTKTLPNGTVVTEWGMASNRRWKTQDGQDREDVLFIDCTAFGRPAEVIAQYVTKGKLLFVSGRLKLDQWEDKQTQAKRSKITGVVENFQFLSPKDDPDSPAGAFGDGGGAIGQQRPAAAPPRAASPQARRPEPSRGGWPPASKAPAPAAADAGPPFGDEQHFSDESIPF